MKKKIFLKNKLNINMVKNASTVMIIRAVINMTMDMDMIMIMNTIMENMLFIMKNMKA